MSSITILFRYKDELCALAFFQILQPSDSLREESLFVGDVHAHRYGRAPIPNIYTSNNNLPVIFKIKCDSIFLFLTFWTQGYGLPNGSIR